MKTICIDARMWGIKNTGIGRYIQCLIDNLPDDPKAKIVLIVSPETMDQLELVRFEKHVAHLHPYSNLAQFEMVWLLLKIKPDLLHVPHFTIPVLWPGKMVITIHDLIKHLSRGAATTTKHQFLYWIKYMQYLLIVWIAVSRAKHIIVPAKFWKDIIANNYKLSKEKISVTYEGVPNNFFLPPSQEFDPPTSRPYLIYTGNVYPHKNVPLLLKAMQQLPELDLVVVCARSVFETRLQKLVAKENLQDRIHFKNSVSDAELVSLYAGAQAFVTPSLIEGFGLPGLEAMAVGIPVIAARASCLPEIYGDAALFFDPLVVQDLVDTVKKVTTDKKVASALVTKGKQQVKKYSWSTMARQTWDIYHHELH